MARVRVVRNHICRVGGQRDGAGKVHLLPTGGGFSGEAGRGQQLSGAGPKVPNVCAGIGPRFVESDAADEATGIRKELYAHFNGRSSAIVANRRRCGTAPDRILRARVDLHDRENLKACGPVVGCRDVNRRRVAPRTSVGRERS